MWFRPIRLAVAHERQKLVTRLLVVPERTQHGAGNGLPVLLLHAAHLHAKVPGLDNDPHPFGTDLLLDSWAIWLVMRS